METTPDNIVVLKIQETLLKCDRLELMRHSDYFKAMFEGNFVESGKNIIPLNGIQLVAMNTILKLLWDREYIIEEENILSVLQAACMLQFLEIKETCMERVQNILCVRNCLKIWLYTEQLDLKPIYLKAKLIAVLEFMLVKETDYLLEMDFNEITNYLGSINLQCSSEFVIFKALIKWYQNMGEKNTDILFKLLHCLDFTRITDAEINNIIASPGITENEQVISILKCILPLKNNLDVSSFQENLIQNANSLLKSKNRNIQGFPCILVDNLGPDQKNIVGNSTVFYYDIKLLALKKLFDVDSQKCASLDGFKMIGYKQFVYLYGGEYLLGKGDWNCEFYMYDIIKEKWSQKESLPSPRRHFESCICGIFLYIVGGTGLFRVIQENIFWYNLEEEKWSKGQKLPCSGRQIKCCPFNNTLFILNINNKCGYTFCPYRGVWSQLEICDNDNILPCYSKKLSLFSYKTSLYIKENKLFELKLQGNRLLIINQIILPENSEIKSNSCQTESVLCNNMLFTLNKQWCEETNKQTISIESFNVDTYENYSNFQKTTDEVLEVDNEIFKFRPSLIMFNVFHQNLVGDNDLINNAHF